MSDALPINYGAPGCPAMPSTGMHGKPAACGQSPEFFGLVGRPAIRVFLCRRHRDLPQLRDVRPMTDVDRAELDGRIVQWDRAMAGLSYDRVGPDVDL